MGTFNENINARRIALGLTYEEVWSALSERKFSEGVKHPSLSAVGNWFNGQRRPRHMEHLVALCDILQTTVKEAAGDQLEPVTATEVALLREVRELSDAQAQALLAVARTMRQS